ncbi:DUF3307 domain-containing protein [Mesorhizobium sp. L-8-10]|uniref:DUF3307 domain-containing protein n=1 Tax=Mesorhizobium sp. L-8-10 TaxID=2744523 RepID=UPI0019279544|nr:DUF3307 domain-containing protein [Mesorhizobium sp. L-8-10]
MQMTTVTLAMLLCFQLKHFVADYLLQPGWIRRGKGDMRCFGGYAHAGLHAFGSLPAFLIAGLEPGAILLLCAAEFTVHYATDHTKDGLSGRSGAGPDSAAYWALHGADQCLHQLTYVGLVFVALASKNGI